MLTNDDKAAIKVIRQEKGWKQKGFVLNFQINFGQSVL